MSLQSATQSVVVLKAKKPTTINVNVVHSANQKPVFLAVNQKMPSNLQPINIQKSCSSCDNYCYLLLWPKEYTVYMYH